MDILTNLALIDLNNFCRKNGIDISGTSVWKVPRKYTYVLAQIKDGKLEGGKSLASVTFHKSSVPTHIIYKD